MIPKIIHYCWFGPNPVPSMVESWRAKLPGYELRAWTEETFDINRLDYTREAYEAGKYAFVSDVARLYALEREGGIYLDTDMEVIHSIDDLLDDTAFVGLGEEVGLHVLAGIIAAEPHHPFMRRPLRAPPRDDLPHQAGTLPDPGSGAERAATQWAPCPDSQAARLGRQEASRR